MAPPFADPPRFDNSGCGPLAVPGFGFPLEHELHPEDRFTHGVREWFQEPNITARELAMLCLMDNITDKPTWSTDVFDDTIVLQLGQEAMRSHLISPKAWDWCLLELQDKARFYQSTGRILVYNTGVVICKSNLKVDEETWTVIKDELSILEPSSHSDTTILDSLSGTPQQTHRLVDPFLYPLVYGKSRVLAKGGLVPLNDMFQQLSKCNIAPNIPVEGYHLLHRTTLAAASRWKMHRQRGPSWSTNFQRLPCEVDFLEEPSKGVRITSYINGLHPRNHGLYHAIERLISTSIEPWNDVLIKQGCGHFPTRIKTYGVSYGPPSPDFDRFTEAGKHPGSESYYAAIEDAKAYCAQPDDFPYDSSDDEVDYPWLEYGMPDDWDAWCRSGKDLARPVRGKYFRLYHFVHPEPGTAYTYQQWKAGQAWEAIVKRKPTDHQPVVEEKTAQIPHKAYRVALHEAFQQKGLQVIVKIDRIELNPSEPRFPGSDWHIEGLHNEHIVANSVYILEEENTSEPRIDFRQETRLDPDTFDHEHDLKAFLQVFDVPYKQQILGGSLETPPSLQRLGSVNLPVGRLLAWPNVLHHRITPFELVDKTRPGRRTFLTLSLVDPNYRICSTRNVPPQNHVWWAEQALAAALPRNVAVPREILDHIDSYTDNWPMGLEEATKVRGQVVKEQKDHERNLMNCPLGFYEFNVDEYNLGDFPSLPWMELGTS
ncbi:hypothetical protein AUEXF2481DRAFT_45131 [Aureobasidium subglaciale EXF-2481]|uniref:Uncharacterized protein n=1 Tax=Aureobasidium subglaciale (strain EXF-2481) TaxID=1043005 RepID=A0A074Y346_AURSE|nr:uncharacterized protein AUEXF2481DRAFT_45131 [Aureobasidium subglaciale EXF-2481]KAI5195588.1 hypothetical protein E4T38_09006 [Aureobasidium subglaciale]KAI5214530.1 hypothetical protein E4T40_08966 [Aureobasidium subglaciale]KAI5217267.1 hypothetical protein E4T41_08925 [Aureobasidium subglaciale]KAI5255008.1 hypothetical protein E4T46_08959 [Aureobasidium subglaciale]KEQ90379.1 hypothetical protein AUEXF2481DRAFT_45131 [Aureobasidium subglaciale EXF-2481]